MNLAKSTSIPLVPASLAPSAAVVALAVILWSPLNPEASEVRIWKTADHDSIAAGTLEGVSVNPEGVLELSREVTRLATLDEPFVFSAAAQDEGWLVGTGNSGKVLSVSPVGEVSEVFAAEEPEIFALLAEKNGAVTVGSSPGGKVYRVQGDSTEVLFDPEATYIWALARDSKGRLLVATGLPGRVYRVDKKGNGEVLYEGKDPHVRAILPRADGSLLVGTAGLGLILEVDAQGKVRTLYDAAQPEVLAFSEGRGGTVYAAVLASEASLVDLSAASTNGGDGEGSEGGVTVVESGQTTLGSRAAGDSGPRSLVLKIQADGTVEVAHSLADETVHSLLWHEGILWVGTGQEGHLYRLVDGGIIREREMEERQVAALVAGKAGAVAMTANGSAVYQLSGSPVADGTYTSKVLDAGEVARFGRFQWQGELPEGTAVGLDFRSGQSTSPDATWSDWQTATCSPGEACAEVAGRKREVSLSDLGPGRYAQWRARLEGARAVSPRIEITEMSYRQENLRPEVKTLEVLNPSEILVPTGFNPQNQSFEPWTPNKQGIFTSVEPAKETSDGRLKTLWKKGYRTLRWTAEDANGDALQYRLSFQPEGGWSRKGSAWMTMVEKLDQTHFSFDATVLPDGVYRFRVQADDSKVHEEGQGLRAEKISAPVVVDHGVPELVSRTRRGGQVEVRLRDALSPLRNAVYSLDAKAWQRAPAEDGLMDGRSEHLRLEVPEDARLLLLRVTDAAWNVVTFDLLTEKP